MAAPRDGRGRPGDVYPFDMPREVYSHDTPTWRRPTEEGMAIDDNREVVRQFIERVFERGETAAVDELVADDFVPHTYPGTTDREGLKRAMERVSQGLDDAKFTIDDVIAEDDRVAVRLTSGATQIGGFMGLPPSGKHYEI